MEEEDKDPFLEDEDEQVVCTDKHELEEDGQRALPSSPILNTPSFGFKFNNGARRKNKMRRSGSGMAPGSSISLAMAHNVETLRVLPSSPNDSILMSQRLESDFVAPKTPVRMTAHQKYPSSSDEDEDIFAAVPCTALSEQAMPSALNTLLDGQECVDVSWTSSMATPLTGNVTWSNLNTEERKVLLPSDDCGLAVRPRALFSPDSNDVADCHSFNVSSDIENLQLKMFKTPKSKERKLFDTSKTSIDSPQSPCFMLNPPRKKDAVKVGKSCEGVTSFECQSSKELNGISSTGTVHSSPNQKLSKISGRVSGDSPILSGSSKFKNTSNQIKTLVLGDEDLFENTEESLNDILPCSPANSKNSSAAESTPNTASRKKSPLIEFNQPSSPLSNDLSNAESFLQDISVATLEKVCQAQEQRAILLPAPLTPEKHPDTKRKRLLFSTNSNPPPIVPLVKIEDNGPETHCPEQGKTKIEENDCIPDDSFMEHLATMSTTILSDSFQPVTRVQSIKTSFSHIKKFSYSVNERPNCKSLRSPVSSKPQTLMKEILSSVVALESASSANIKTKSVKFTRDLIVFSQLQEELNESAKETPEKIIHTDISEPVSELTKNSDSSKKMSDTSVHSSEGFQTASGNSIKLSQEAINKGLSILKDMLNAPEEDKPTDPNCGTSDLSTSTIQCEFSEACQNAYEAPAFSNDQMVQAAEEVKQLLQLVNNGEDFNPWHEMEPVDFKESSDVLSDPKHGNVTGLLDKFTNNEDILNQSEFVSNSNFYKRGQHSPSDGFSTASGRNILVSEKNLSKAKQLLCELVDKSGDPCERDSEASKFITEFGIQTDGDVTQYRKNYRHAGLIEATKVPTPHSAENDSSAVFGNHSDPNSSLQKTIESETKSHVDRKRRSFQTSENNLVVPTKKPCLDSFSPVESVTCCQQSLTALAKGEGNNPCLDSSSSNIVHKCVLELSEFSKNMSEQSQKDENEDSHFFNLQNYRHQMVPESRADQSNLGGFSTASGKTVNVSKEALRKVENLFDNLSEVNDKDHPSGRKNKDVLQSTVEQAGKARSSTASGKSGDVQGEALQKTKHIYDEPSEADEKNQGVPQLNLEQSEKVGFSTASGKSVNVSLKALKKVRKLFDDLSDVNDEVHPKGRNPQSKVILENEGALQSTVEQARKVGFSTASGKSVDVSTDALKKVKNLFDDFSEVNDEVYSSEGRNQDLPQSQKVEFSTASGKYVNVSSAAMKKVKNLFDGLSEVNDENHSSEGKNSSLLKSTVKQAEKLGFSTASGKSVNVSSEAMKKVKNLFDDLSEVNDKVHTNKVLKQGLLHSSVEQSENVGGFSTAGGRTVTVSAEALCKVKGLFNTADLLSDPPFDLGQVDTTLAPHNERSMRNNTSKSAKDSILMAGFSMASGRTVNVTKEALSKAKNIFDDVPSDSVSVSGKNLVSIQRKGMQETECAAKDDSGVFLSHDMSSVSVPPSKMPKIAGSNSFKAPGHKSSTFSNCLGDNKENCDKSTVYNPNHHEIQKASLTQEITASTAAFLADEEFFNEAECLDAAVSTLKTICTSPSMVTDRGSSLRPVISSLTEESGKSTEPTSPILVKSESMGFRRRCRRGRLSLSSISASRSSSPILKTPPVISSQMCDLKLEFPFASTASSNNLITSQTSSVLNNKKAEMKKALNHKDLPGDESCSMLGVKNAPSRKLFVGESTLSPVKMDSTNTLGDSAPSPAIVISPNCSNLHTKNSNYTPNAKDSLGSKNVHQMPLMKKTLTRSHCGQSSAFRTPYKTNSEEHFKRCPSSPAQNPPEAKRRKSSANLYASHIELCFSESAYSNNRTLRPEVIEMRRRSATEQKQLVENHVEEKGELLQPHPGSWFTTKMSCGETLLKLSKMNEIEQPRSYSPNDLLNIGLKPSTLSVTATNCAEFRFSAWEYYSEDVCRENVAGLPVGDGARLVLDFHGLAGIEEVERAFLASPGVDPSLIPSGWIQNHYRWLVWKLAAMEKMFPHHFGGRCLTPHILMLQLKYRYDREIDRCERPALRRILEHDDSAAKRMVLCVASIKSPKDSNQGSVGVELELTDGWYSVIASIDPDMQRMVSKGVIAIGSKLIMHSAELLNCSEGCSPLQARPEVRLKLYSNSTRRARWYTKLGFQPNPGPLKISLTSILGSGGVVSCVFAYVARVYPVVYMEKKDEKTVVRSQRAETKEVAKCEKKRQQMAEVVYSQVQAEIQKEHTNQRRSSVKFSLKQLSTLTTGEELAEILENTSDPLTVQNMLSEDQKSIIFEYQRSKQEELCRDLEARVRMKLSENPNNERQVTPILKVRLIDCRGSNQSTTAILSVWRPSEDVSSVFKEGHKIAIFGTVANGSRCGELQLSANRSTRYHPNSSEVKSDILRYVSPLSSLTHHGVVPCFGELDIVGVVFRIGPAPQTSENTTHFQTAYLSDSEQNIIGVSFWEGIKEFGVEDLIAPRSLIAASSLQWRGGPVVRAIPCVYASELSFFTTVPRQSYLQASLQNLRRSLPADLKAFCCACEEKLNSLLSQNISSPASHPRTLAAPPSTPNLATCSLSKHNSTSSSVWKETPSNLSSKQNISTVKAQRKLAMDHQLNTPTSSNGLSPDVEKRIAKLEAYGTPSSLSPIIIPHPRRSLRKDFKAPRRTDTPLSDKKIDKALNNQS